MIFIYSECWSGWSSPSPSQNILLSKDKKSYIHMYDSYFIFQLKIKKMGFSKY